jgi:hypothetical protein
MWVVVSRCIFDLSPIFGTCLRNGAPHPMLKAGYAAADGRGVGLCIEYSLPSWSLPPAFR